MNNNNYLNNVTDDFNQKRKKKSDVKKTGISRQEENVLCNTIRWLTRNDVNLASRLFIIFRVVTTVTLNTEEHPVNIMMIVIMIC